jgi:hypothetical protein
MTMDHTRGARASSFIAVALLAIVSGAACRPPAHGHGTLQGHVTAGPTCPVERIPPDPQCADRPVVDAQVDAVSGSTRLSTRTDVEGFYTLALPAGVAFTVTVGTGRFPACPPLSVTVTAGQTTTRDVSCDTGIR